jgi:hypothetical protein
VLPVSLVATLQAVMAVTPVTFLAIVVLPLVRTLVVVQRVICLPFNAELTFTGLVPDCADTDHLFTTSVQLGTLAPLVSVIVSGLHHATNPDT